MDRGSEVTGIEIAAQLICLAARTAPKARGKDNLIVRILAGENKEALARKMEEIGEKYNPRIFKRDAQNVRQATLIILLGSKTDVMNLDCGFCGYSTCEELKKTHGHCAYVAGDLGIAIGSAVSKAADLRVDNRIMYSAGYAALKSGLMGDAKMVFGLPLSGTGKNPFFDRK